MNAQKEEELVQCHLLERKRLPKILKSDTKTRTMMYRESLRITGGEFSLEEERERMKQVPAYMAFSTLNLFKHFVAYSTWEICIHTKTQYERYTTGD